MFSTSFSSSKLILPTPAWTLPPLSERYSTLPALNSLTAAATSPVGRDDGAGLRRRHQAARAEHLTEPRHLAHHVLRGEGHVEVEPVLLLDLLDQVGAAGDVGPGRLGLGDVVALAEDDDADRLADAVRQRRRCRGPSGRTASRRCRAFMWISTVSSNLARLIVLSVGPPCLTGTAPFLGDASASGS